MHIWLLRANLTSVRDFDPYIHQRFEFIHNQSKLTSLEMLNEGDVVEIKPKM